MSTDINISNLESLYCSSIKKKHYHLARPLCAVCTCSLKQYVGKKSPTFQSKNSSPKQEPILSATQQYSDETILPSCFIQRRAILVSFPSRREFTIKYNSPSAKQRQNEQTAVYLQLKLSHCHGFKGELFLRRINLLNRNQVFCCWNP